MSCNCVCNSFLFNIHIDSYDLFSIFTRAHVMTYPQKHYLRVCLSDHLLNPPINPDIREENKSKKIQ